MDPPLASALIVTPPTLLSLAVYQVSLIRIVVVVVVTPLVGLVRRPAGQSKPGQCWEDALPRQATRRAQRVDHPFGRGGAEVDRHVRLSVGFRSRELRHDPHPRRTERHGPHK